VTEGDPTWAGPLAGEPLGLPVYHILEEEIKSQIDSELYESEVGIAEMTLETEDIIQAVREVRNGAQTGA
jgi:glycine reductase